MSITKKSASASKPKADKSAVVVDTTNAKLDALKPATETAASGALIEPTIVDRIDTGHVSVDDEPRKGATKEMNQIDFNTPSGLVSEEDQVVANLSGAQD